jgi:hypothetical protein
LRWRQNAIVIHLLEHNIIVAAVFRHIFTSFTAPLLEEDGDAFAGSHAEVVYDGNADTCRENGSHKEICHDMSCKVFHIFIKDTESG